jgi:hypothetical protein
MGLFSRLFGESDGSAPVDNTADDPTLACDSCGCEVDDGDMQEGQCPECYESEYTGSKFCCGMIYEEGEDTCASCGESL